MATEFSVTGNESFVFATASPKAHQACLTCKRQKRKCDKELPACGLCVRMTRQCDYSDPPPLPSYDDIGILHSKIQELEARLHVAVAGHASRLPLANDDGSHNNDNNSRNSEQPCEDRDWSIVRNRFPSIAFLDCEAFQLGRHVTRAVLV